MQARKTYAKKYVKKTYKKYPKKVITHGYTTSRNVQGELYAKDTTINLNAVPVATLVILNDIAEGNDIQERKGRKIVMKSLNVKGSARVLATTVAEYGSMKIAAVYDMQANGVAPTAAQIWNDSTTGTGSTRNLDNRDRFKVLFEKTYSFGPGQNQSIPLEIFKKVSLPVIYKGTTGEIASISTGSLYIFTWGSVLGDVANHGCALVATCRLRYSDV